VRPISVCFSRLHALDFVGLKKMGRYVSVFADGFGRGFHRKSVDFIGCFCWHASCVNNTGIEAAAQGQEMAQRWRDQPIFGFDYLRRML
jgi:hypothetical protein